MDTAPRISLKQSNRKIILNMFRESSVLSVSDVSLKTGISKPTVQKVINHFAETGYILPEGKGNSTDEGGKKPLLYSFNQLLGYVVTIHVGPDFMHSAIIDMKSQILQSDFRKLDDIGIEEVTRMCADVISDYSKSDLVQNSRIISISIALPGIVSASEGVLVYTPHFPGWGNDYPFVGELKKLVSVSAPILCDNINRYQAFAEMKAGKAIGKRNFMIIDAMEEGLGSGIVVNGQLKHGAQNFSGEIGHMLLMPTSGPKCICGGKGCFEALVSLKRINALINEGRKLHDNSLIFTDENNETMLKRLFAAFVQGDEFAIVIMDEIAFWFASGINNVIMINDPELIILEGIYTTVGDSFIELIKFHLERLAYPGIERKVQIVMSDFGNERGILGAGTYAIWSFFNQVEFYSD
ncbi:MAG TPA: hypothetical protein DCO79_01605 [Spirochaeta sp.]|nr:hypothetical protein [Spirochaeta sp.]